MVEEDEMLNKVKNKKLEITLMTWYKKRFVNFFAKLPYYIEYR